MYHSKSKRVPENIYFCFIDYTKAFDCVDHNKLWKILKEMGIPDHLTCLLRNLCSSKGKNRTRHGTTDWFQIGKGVRESIPRQIDKKFRVPKEEKGVWGS